MSDDYVDISWPEHCPLCAKADTSHRHTFGAANDTPKPRQEPMSDPLQKIAERILCCEHWPHSHFMACAHLPARKAQSGVMLVALREAYELGKAEERERAAKISETITRCNNNCGYSIAAAIRRKP